MRKDLFDELLASVKEMKAIHEGRQKPSRVTCASDLVGSEPDVAALRARFKLSQTQFVALLGINVSTLQNWEQGRRRPVGGHDSLGGDAIVFGVRPDPKPQDAVGDINGERAIMRADSHRMEALHALEVERWMTRVGFQQRELLVSERADGGGKCVVASPERWRGVVVQSFRERPAAWSASASSAS